MIWILEVHLNKLGMYIQRVYYVEVFASPRDLMLLYGIIIKKGNNLCKRSIWLHSTFLLSSGRYLFLCITVEQGSPKKNLLLHLVGSEEQNSHLGESIEKGEIWSWNVCSLLFGWGDRGSLIHKLFYLENCCSPNMWSISSSCHSSKGISRDCFKNLDWHLT